MHLAAQAAQAPDPPPDPGFEISVQAADAIVEAEIVAGGPFRAAALAKKVLKGSVPDVFELEGFNSYYGDTVHQGFAFGTRYILFLSRTERPGVFATLTPAAPRLSIQPDGVLLALGDPPFRIPLKRAVMEEALALLLEKNATGQVPSRAEAYLRGQFDAGDIEPRYLAVALAGALKDPRAVPLLAEASRDKLLKMRLTAVDSLGKMANPPACAALRALLKDDKATVSREAARALAAAGDMESLPGLLEWARKTLAAAQKAKEDGNAKMDPNRAKTESAIADVLALAAEAGPLLDGDAPSFTAPLLEIARLGDDSQARAALAAYISRAKAADVPALLELADDANFSRSSLAAAALQRLTLAPFRSAAEFRSWWDGAARNFGEDSKRARVESAAKAVLAADSFDRRALADVLRAAPGEIALVSAAPLILRRETATVFSSEDLSAWDSALALPFLLERLGRDNTSERRDALEGLAKLSAKHPRLRAVLWPYLRGGLADDDSGYRRIAQRAAGQLGQVEAVGALVDAIQYGGNYESLEAIKPFYALTARTLGFSTGEPMPDQLAAHKRLRGWWDAAQKDFRPIPAPVWTGSDAGNSGRVHAGPFALRFEMAAADRAGKLEAFVLDPDSRRSASAFALLYAERGPDDAYWKKLTAQGRQRDRAHGLLGFLGGEPALAGDLAKRLAAGPDNPEAPLIRALSMVALATLKDGGSSTGVPAGDGKAAGAEKIVEWLQGPGARGDIVWRRLAIVSLGLSSGEPRSLAWLETALQAGMNAPKPAIDEEPSEDAVLLFPVLAALNARADSNALLRKVLSEGTQRMRESAARALSMRRDEKAIPGILKALEETDRFGWQDLYRALDPLVKPADAPLVAALLDGSNVAARSAAAYLLGSRPDVGNDAGTRARLLAALSDASPTVRFHSALGLGRRRAPEKEVLKKLTELLRDDDDDVCAAAAEAVGAIGDPEASAAAASAFEFARPKTGWLRALAIAGEKRHLDLLVRLVNSTAFADQRFGVDALGSSNDPLALSLLLKTFRNETAFQTVAGDALARKGDAAVELLAPDLKSADKSARARAIHLLSRIDSPAAAAAANAAAAAKDEDAALRALAEFVLKRLNAKR